MGIKSSDLPVEVRRKLGIAQRKPPRPVQPNKWETQFGETHLHPKLVAGILDGYLFEGIHLVLPGNTGRYTPDWVAFRNREICNIPTASVIVYEVKGFWREAAKMRYKLAMACYPWIEFHCYTRRGGKFVEIFV